MSLLDWLIVIIPVAFVMYMGYRSRSYVRGVADFLSAGRICGRYVISVADVANGLEQCHSSPLHSALSDRILRLPLP